MPVTKTAKKALRSSLRKREINKPIKSRALTAIKKMKKDPNEENLKNTFSAMDKAVKKNILDKGRVSRLKSRLAKLIKNEKKAETKKTTKTKAAPKTKAPKAKTSKTK